MIPPHLEGPASDSPPTDAEIPTVRRPRGWWRRNTVALVALAVLLPASVLAIGWREWSAVYDSATQRTHPVLAGDDGTVALDGATWGPVTSGIFTAADDLPVPDGAKVVAVKVRVDNDDLGDPTSCPAPVLIEQSTGRQWSEMSTALGLGYDPDYPLTCTSDPTGPYELLVPFIVPVDAEGPFWVEVAPYDTAPSFARFSIAP
ncbi:MAG: hypothetical protein J7484_14600 [Microbacterium sp.]|nr:hypothetical protein [Microbacterium sp.]